MEYGLEMFPRATWIWKCDFLSKYSRICALRIIGPSYSGDWLCIAGFLGSTNHQFWDPHDCLQDDFPFASFTLGTPGAVKRGDIKNNPSTAPRRPNQSDRDHFCRSRMPPPEKNFRDSLGSKRLQHWQAAFWGGYLPSSVWRFVGNHQRINQHNFCQNGWGD